MDIFIDSADLEEIKLAYGWGVVGGITTNPSLLKIAVEKRAKKGEKTDLKRYILELLTIAKGTPVSLEVSSFTTGAMIDEGKRLFTLFNPYNPGNLYIKIPVNPAFKEEDETHFDGIIAIRALTKLKIPINCTIISTPEQALLAAKAGANFISPFVGRIDDYLREKHTVTFEKKEYYPAEGQKGWNDNGIISGIDLVEKCVKIIKHYGFTTKVLAASLRNPRQVRDAALVGADIATLPLSVLRDMLKHPTTYEGMRKFTHDTVKEYTEMK
jgi:transaldolase